MEQHERTKTIVEIEDNILRGLKYASSKAASGNNFQGLGELLTGLGDALRELRAYEKSIDLGKTL